MTDIRPPAIDPYTQECIERYLVEGPSTLNDPDVAEAVARHPDLTQHLSNVTDQWRFLPTTSVAASLQETKRRLGLQEFEDTASLPPSTSPSSPRTQRAVAGQPSISKSPRWGNRMIALTAVLGVLFGAILMNRVNRSQDHTPSVLRVHTTAKGERSNIMLADGTRIILGVKSQLRYDPYATTGARDIYLDGEAYFNVVPNAQRPLVVHAKHTTTRVLGTEFIVRAYTTDTAVRVAVATGRVALDNTVLNAGDVGVHAASRVTVLHSPDVTSSFAWTHGQIVFDDTPLAVVIHELSRWYDVQFRIADSTLNRRVISTTFTDRTPDAVADAIAAALRIRYERQGNTITFRTEASK